MTLYSPDFVNHSVLPRTGTLVINPRLHLFPSDQIREACHPSLVPVRDIPAPLFPLSERRFFQSHKLRYHIREWSVSTHSEVFRRYPKPTCTEDRRLASVITGTVG